MPSQRKARITHSLMFRSSLIVAVCVVGVAALVLFFINSVVKERTASILDAQLRHEGAEIEYHLQLVRERTAAVSKNRTLSIDDISAVLQSRVEMKEGYVRFAECVDVHGVVQWRSRDFPSDLPVVRRADPTTNEYYRAKGHLLAEIPINLFAGSIAWVRFGLHDEGIRNLASSLGVCNWIVIGAAMVLGPLIAFALSYLVLAPLRRVIKQAAALRPQNLDVRLADANTTSEADMLAGAINNLLRRIQAYVDRQTEFVAHAAHELRSPLTAIRQRAELGTKQPRSKDENIAYFEEICDECDFLRVLIDRLLMLAESDTRQVGGLLSTDSCSLTRVVKQTHAMFEPVAEEKQITLHLDVEENVTLPANVAYVRQLVRNLVDNAIKYTDPKGSVYLTLKSQAGKDSCQFIVRDTGIGIPQDDLQLIFERFHRADKARKRGDSKTGYGLGLAICKAVVRGLKGQIEVQSVENQGTTFTVTLPTKRPSGIPDAQVTPASSTPHVR